MPFNLGTGELLIFGLVALLVFGGRLPKVAKQVGSMITQFRRGLRDEMRKIESSAEDAPAEEPEPPADWTPPPDGEDCPGLN